MLCFKNLSSLNSLKLLSSGAENVIIFFSPRCGRSLHTNHIRTQQPRTHKLAEVSCSNGESGEKVAVFKVEVQTLL